MRKICAQFHFESEQICVNNSIFSSGGNFVQTQCNRPVLYEMLFKEKVNGRQTTHARQILITIQEVFHANLNKFEIAVSHLFLIVFSNNKFTMGNLISRNAQSPKN